MVRCWSKDSIDCDNSNIAISNSKTKNVKLKSAKKGRNASKEYRSYAMNIYKPCYLSLTHLIHDRPELLLGKWMDWDFL